MIQMRLHSVLRNVDCYSRFIVVAIKLMANGNFLLVFVFATVFKCFPVPHIAIFHIPISLVIFPVFPIYIFGVSPGIIIGLVILPISVIVFIFSVIFIVPLVALGVLLHSIILTFLVSL